jgi:hypothetical protein
MLLGKQLNYYTIIIKVLLLGLLSTIAALFFFQVPLSASDSAVSRQTNNPIVIENIKPGTTDWQLINPAKNREIEAQAITRNVLAKMLSPISPNF